MKTFFMALAMFALTATVANAACGVSSPVNVDVIGQAITDIHNGGTWDGTHQLQGSADCSNEFAAARAYSDSAADKAVDEAAALSAAMSAPVWLGEGESFRVSGGVGFSDGEAAGGVTALMRINRNVAGYAGGAVGSEHWAGKAGLSIGW